MVGGLLAVRLLSSVSGSSVFYPIYDGNGNVEAYLDSSGVAVAIYQYDAFGNVLTGAGAGDATSQAAFRHQFSTKYHDAETGLLYYGYRYYHPGTGRWLSHEPLGEAESLNLYAFVENDGISQIDVLGLASQFAGSAAAAAAMGGGIYLGRAAIGGAVEGVAEQAIGDTAEASAYADAGCAELNVDPLSGEDYLKATKTGAWQGLKGGALFKGAQRGWKAGKALWKAGRGPGGLFSRAPNPRAVSTSGNPVSRVDQVAGSETLDDSLRFPIIKTVNNFRGPSSRHTLTRVNQKTLARDRNTVVEPGVDVAGDVAAINQGLAKKVGDKFEINGRVYGMNDGTLYPVSGLGFHQLSRPAFKALGVLNKFGDTPQAHKILQNMGTSDEALEAALNAWRTAQ